ncbi:helix-turn-helix domain-containing protein [Pararhizobium sp. YC-54]|uniref:helix-turn-helix domain-containing protein n=1 Tax=Pararhizobium sp. YC-54 TaxID=2986920 RepID=UPI00299D4D29|nr:helix-turn-helix domain-containing protein [Pararhizobium sp. YC-54]
MQLSSPRHLPSSQKQHLPALRARGVPVKHSIVPPGSGTLADPWGPVLSVAAHHRCRLVRQVTAEMVMLVGERVPLRRDRRRTSCHVRQISMYVCHVILQISLTDIGYSFGRDRTTVSHACNVVEDRRDDRAFDDFIAALERVVTCFFGAPGGRDHA